MPKLGVNARRWRVADWLTVALLLLTALRMAVICMVHPIVGYANNLDFFRQSACVGLWQAYIKLPAITDHLQGPVDDLVRNGKRIPAYCMQSSDNLFPWLAAHLYAKNTHLPLRLVGTLKALVTLGFIITITFQTSCARKRLFVAAFFYLLFGDIVVLAYFNTLYVDASGLISAGLAAILVVISIWNRDERGWLHSIIMALCLLWLGSVKPQYSGLALVLGSVSTCVYVFSERDWRRGLLIASATIGGVVAFSALNDSPTSIMRAVSEINTADSLLGAILPRAIDRPQALHVLGLPQSCDAAIGLTGHSPEIEQHRACPEIRTLHRWRFLPLFIYQPTALMSALKDAALVGRPTSPQLNYVVTPPAEAQWIVRLIRSTSLSTLIACITNTTYEYFVAFCGAFSLAFCVMLIVASATVRNNLIARCGCVCVAPALGGVIVLYGLISSVLGDGFVELARHEAAMLIGFTLIAVSAIHVATHAKMFSGMQNKQSGL